LKSKRKNNKGDKIMEDEIISRALFLMVSENPIKLNECVTRAVKELGSMDFLAEIYRIFDLTEKEYIDYLCNRIRMVAKYGD